MFTQLNGDKKNFQSYNQWYVYINAFLEAYASELGDWKDFDLVLELGASEKIMKGIIGVPQYYLPVKSIIVIINGKKYSLPTKEFKKDHLVYDIKKLERAKIKPTKSFTLTIYHDLDDCNKNHQKIIFHKTKLEQK
jgi:hypothetical protein